MKLKDILAIQSIVESRATPYDLLESGYTYYSKSKDEYIDLLEKHSKINGLFVLDKL
jgi:hypothetical protein